MAATIVNSTTATSTSVNFNCVNGDGMLVAFAVNMGGGGYDAITGMTWNASAATKILSTGSSGTNYWGYGYLGYVPNPTTGTHAFTWACSYNVGSIAIVEITGCATSVGFSTQAKLSTTVTIESYSSGLSLVGTLIYGTASGATTQTALWDVVRDEGDNRNDQRNMGAYAVGNGSPIVFARGAVASTGQALHLAMAIDDVDAAVVANNQTSWWY